MVNASFSQQLLFTLAQPQASTCYTAAGLSPQDTVRAARQRSPKAELDWRVSRALLHACRQREIGDRVESLSHSHGHAIVAQAPLMYKLGVDMEMVRPRRVMALAEWACNAAETDWLLGQEDEPARLTSFYMLWTLKEAFVKAAGLAFPAALSRVGLDCTNGHPLSLRAPSGAWQARTYLLGSDCMVSVVWLPISNKAKEAEPLWCAGPSSILPSVVTLEAWR
jgi:4'-phosphopantetheinyl transferase